MSVEPEAIPSAAPDTGMGPRRDRLPIRLRFWFLCLLVFIAVESLDRLTLSVWVGLDRPGQWPDLLLGFPVGLLDDAATGIVLGLPFIVGLTMLAPMFRRRGFAWLAHVGLLAMLLGLAFIEVAEIFFWNEFDSRLNGIAFFYLLFPHEVIGNIRESFDVGRILPVIGLVAAIAYLIMRRPLSRALEAAQTRGDLRTSLSAAAVLGVASLVLFQYGPVPSGGSREANEVAMNGLHTFLRAALTNDADYDGLYPVLPEAEASAIAQAAVSQKGARMLAPTGKRSLLRHIDNGANPLPLNVVLVMEESFGMTYVDGRDAQQESVSPNLMRLAEDGLFFTNLYATGNRTVRGLEAIMTSFPPIPGISTSRRPGSEGMNSIPFLLKQHGYDTAFLYGGRALFDNMGHYWSTIGFDQVWDQSDIAEDNFRTIWGVADEYLFTEAIKRMDAHAATGKPMFLSLLTVSNHRPYTYPDGRIGKPSDQKRRVNAATYADWAFGNFIERAKRHSWFKDTIFIFIGDHGPRTYGAAQVPVQSYRVPLLFYAPGHIAARQVATLGSSMDLGPTLLGLLGISYDTPFFGVDLLRIPPERGRVLMEHNYSVAFGDGEHVAILPPSNPPKGYAMSTGPNDLQPETAPDPEALRRAIGIYQTAQHMFYAHEYHDLGDKANQEAAVSIPVRN